MAKIKNPNSCMNLGHTIELKKNKKKTEQKEKNKLKQAMRTYN